MEKKRGGGGEGEKRKKKEEGERERGGGRKGENSKKREEDALTDVSLVDPIFFGHHWNCILKCPSVHGDEEVTDEEKAKKRILMHCEACG